MRGFRTTLAALLGVGFVAAAAQAQTPAPAETADVVIARVNGQEILRSELMSAYAQLPAQTQQMGMEIIYPLLLDRVIDEKLIGVAASEKVPADDPEVAEQMARIRERVVMQVYFSRLLDEKVTDERLRAEYEKYLAANPPVEEVSARHILLDTEEKAKEVLAEVKAGKDFAEAAKEHSTGPSGPNGGDLGYFTADAMVKPFSDAAFAMQPGEISAEPVKTEFGWHIIKLEDRRMKPQPSFEDMREQLTKETQQAVATEIIDGLRGAATIEKFDIDGNPLPAPAPETPAADQPVAPETPATEQPAGSETPPAEQPAQQ